MEEELKNLMKVSTSVSLLMTYARFASAHFPPGRCRLLALLPVIAILPSLPCLFTTLHLRGLASFFLSWLAVFKLLLLSFALGPLSPSLPLSTFISIASLPVKPTAPNSTATTAVKPTAPNSTATTAGLFGSTVRAALLAGLITLYDYREHINHYLLLVMFCFHIYLALELALAIAAGLTKSLLGLELEPQFNEPYRSSSLQDFWGRRWNLMVTGILRPSVYFPVSAIFGSDVGVLATFLVSGIMHEVLFYYLTCAPPTGKALGFFVLNGFATAVEVKVKRAGWRPNTALTGPAAIGFVIVSSFWLFFPAMMRNEVDEKALQESRAITGFFVWSWRVVVGWMGL